MRTLPRAIRSVNNLQKDPMVLTLYSRLGCHLCEDMLETLESFRDDMNFSLEVLDIDRDPVLFERFNTLVPVLMCGDLEICHYYLDKVALSRVLEQQS